MEETWKLASYDRNGFEVDDYNPMEVSYIEGDEIDSGAKESENGDEKTEDLPNN
jgi:hypothetical protein